MPNPLALATGDLAGARLSVADYRADFRTMEKAIVGEESWKLERRQHFRQPGSASWEAFVRGDWGQALRLIEDRREVLSQFAAEAKALGTDLYRVRVVEEPIMPYLQWELHSLRLRAECGELIRVVSGEQIRDLETDGALPELVTLGPSVAYHILYDSEGELAGGVKITDPVVVGRITDLTRSLYETGQDLETFFEHAVASLPSPIGDRIPDTW
jgi:hypothetical protein